MLSNCLELAQEWDLFQLTGMKANPARSQSSLQIFINVFHSTKKSFCLFFYIKFLTWKEDTHAGRVRLLFYRSFVENPGNRKNDWLCCHSFSSPSWLHMELDIRICKNSITERTKPTSSMPVALSKGWIWLLEVVWFEFPFKGERWQNKEKNQK